MSGRLLAEPSPAASGRIGRVGVHPWLMRVLCPCTDAVYPLRDSLSNRAPSETCGAAEVRGGVHGRDSFQGMFFILPWRG